MEKYEFRNDTTLPPEVKAAANRVREVLWERIEKFKVVTKQVLQNMFGTADTLVKEHVEGS